MLNFRVLFSIVFLLVYSIALHAELAQGTAEYRYGPETSQAKACKLALDKAKANALASVMGEAVSTEQELFCKETSGKKSNYDCEYNSATWSLIDGDMKTPRIISEGVKEIAGAKVCTVSLEVDIIVPNKKPDPNFEVKAKKLRSVYKVDDDFTIDFESTMPAYFAIFNWLPYEGNQVIRVLLTSSGGVFDSDYLKKNAEGKYQFKQTFVATWSKAYKPDEGPFDERVLIVVTKKPYKWLSSYDYDSFREKLHEIPNDEKRLVRLMYQLNK
jgi:hypothetical protein